MVELGRVGKPEVAAFAGKKKLYCIRNVFSTPDSPEEYRDLVDRYWEEVTQQLEKLEIAGKTRKIFYESIYIQGEEALQLLDETNPPAARIVRKRMEEGAVFFPLEKEEIFGPYLDWGRCLGVVATQEVFDQVRGFYTEYENRRFEHIMQVILDNLAEGEAGLLIMRDEDRMKLQFPSEIEVFLVTPPPYDNLVRWLRERMQELNV
ncbi:MAG: hypothetical protein K8I29_00035 [Alphaproteobacteria bacterium]|uniref:Uncharacterized protein n=1 Tax=Candidatus Nitrobium versatile TaxID=2884831 RepID=A0A953J1K8_9BACT|nr:hypothetical protein [Candidatus Nitrobium versatile]